VTLARPEISVDRREASFALAVAGARIVLEVRSAGLHGADDDGKRNAGSLEVCENGKKVPSEDFADPPVRVGLVDKLLALFGCAEIFDEIVSPTLSSLVFPVGRTRWHLRHSAPGHSQIVLQPADALSKGG
jgi:hypothetical protein